MLWGNARTGVLDCQHEVRSLDRRPHQDRAALRGVPDGVRDQVLERLLDSILIAGNGVDTRRALGDQRDSLVGHDRGMSMADTLEQERH